MAASTHDMQSKINHHFRFTLPAGNRQKAYRMEFVITRDDVSAPLTLTISCDSFNGLYGGDVELARLIYLSCYHGEEKGESRVKPNGEAFVLSLKVGNEDKDAKKDAIAILDKLMSLKGVELPASSSNSGHGVLDSSLELTQAQKEQRLMNALVRELDSVVTEPHTRSDSKTTLRDVLFATYQTLGGTKTLDDFAAQPAPKLQAPTEPGEIARPTSCCAIM